MKPHIKPRSKSERLRDATFAKGGGADKMFPEQAAGKAKPGITGKAPTPAPGAARAAGGPKTSRGPSLSIPSKPGRTAPATKGR